MMQDKDFGLQQQWYFIQQHYWCSGLFSFTSFSALLKFSSCRGPKSSRLRWVDLLCVPFILRRVNEVWAYESRLFRHDLVYSSSKNTSSLSPIMTKKRTDACLRWITELLLHIDLEYDNRNRKLGEFQDMQHRVMIMKTRAATHLQQMQE